MECKNHLARLESLPHCCEGPVPSANKSGMRGSPCSPPSPCGMSCELPISSSHTCVGRAAVEHPHEGEDLISTVHPQETLQHNLSGDQIVRPHAINRHHCGFFILVGHGLYDVCDAEGVLEGCCGLLGLFGHLLRNGSRHKPPHDVSHDDPPHTSIWLLEGCESSQPDALQRQCWDLSLAMRVAKRAKAAESRSLSNRGKRCSERRDRL